VGGAAWLIGVGTNGISERLGPAATGVVQSTLGNLLSPVNIGALVLAAVAIWQITGDGRALAFEGRSLVAL
jgi:hypothetical protein